MQTTLKAAVHEGRPDRVKWDVGVAHGEDPAAHTWLDAGRDQQRPLPPEPPLSRSTARRSLVGATAAPRLLTFHGNLLDVAAGISLGLAAGKVVTSFVSDVLLPPIGQLLGGVNFPDLFWVLDQSKGAVATLAQARAAGLPVIAYGQWLGTALDFLLVAACVLVAVKLLNIVRRHQQPLATLPAMIKTCSACCSAIPMRATRCPYCTSIVK